MNQRLPVTIAPSPCASKQPYIAAQAKRRSKAKMFRRNEPEKMTASKMRRRRCKQDTKVSMARLRLIKFKCHEYCFEHLNKLPYKVRKVWNATVKRYTVCLKKHPRHF